MMRFEFQVMLLIAGVAALVTAVAMLSGSRWRAKQQHEVHLEGDSLAATARLYRELIRQQWRHEPTAGTAAIMVLSVLVPIAFAVLGSYVGLRVADKAGALVGAGVGVALAFFLLMLTSPLFALKAGRRHQRGLHEHGRAGKTNHQRPRDQDGR